MDTARIMFALLRFELNGTELSDDVKNSLAPETLVALYRLSKQHDLAHLVGDALNRNGVLQKGTEAYKIFLKERSLAIYRHEQQEYELREICRVFEEAGIEYLPLKGAVIREHYPEPWMRTSCDIDVLVHDGDVPRAKSALIEKLGYKDEGKISHDWQMVAPSGVHVELHYELIEEYVKASSANVLSDVWEQTEAHAESSLRRVMRDEIYYFYHVAHMAKHFENGGCGIRPFLDLRILDNDPEADWEKRNERIARGNLQTFVATARALSDVWMAGAEHTELTREMESYILQGGVYGNSENQRAVQHVKKKNKFRYALSQIFLPYGHMKLVFPVLEKQKWLYPFCVAVRCFRLVFSRKKMKKSVQALKNFSDVQSDKTDAVKKLLKELGL